MIQKTHTPRYCYRWRQEVKMSWKEKLRARSQNPPKTPKKAVNWRDSLKERLTFDEYAAGFDKPKAASVSDLKKKADPSFLTDTQRITRLPIRDHTENETAVSTGEYEKGTEYTLRPIQVSALQQIRECKGLLAPIGVGHGKSLIALLAGTAIGAELTVILTPASTVDTLRKTAREMSKHFKIPKNIRIYSYATLSQAKRFVGVGTRPR